MLSISLTELNSHTLEIHGVRSDLIRFFVLVAGCHELRIIKEVKVGA
jgi:hypothetical protein